MEFLPEEVIETIVEFLLADDIVSLSSTCKRLRNVLNKNRIWKPFCKLPENYYQNLNKSTLRKSMRFVCKKDSKLEELCAGKVNYLLQKQILSSWESGKFKTVEVESELEGILCMVDALDKHGYHWLFLKGPHKIEAWNITNEPVFHASIDTPVNSRVRTHLHALEGKVVLINVNLVHIYSFDQPKYTLSLLCCFCVNQREQFQLTSQFNYNWDCQLIGDKIVGHACKTNLRDFKLHIWDLNGFKFPEKNVVGEEITSNVPGYLRISVGTTKTQACLYIFYDDDFEKRTLVKFFDMKMFKFTFLYIFWGEIISSTMTEDLRIILFLNSFNINSFRLATIKFSRENKHDPKGTISHISDVIGLSEFHSAIFQAHAFEKKLAIQGECVLYSSNLNNRSFESFSRIIELEWSTSKWCFVSPKFVVIPEDSFKCTVIDVLNGRKLFEVLNIQGSGQKTEVIWCKEVFIPPKLILMSGGRVFALDFLR